MRISFAVIQKQWRNSQKLTLSNKKKDAIYICIYSSNLYLFVWIFDHKSGSFRPICLKFVMENSEEPRECSQLDFSWAAMDSQLVIFLWDFNCTFLNQALPSLHVRLHCTLTSNMFPSQSLPLIFKVLSFNYFIYLFLQNIPPENN